MAFFRDDGYILIACHLVVVTVGAWFRKLTHIRDNYYYYYVSCV